MTDIMGRGKIGVLIIAHKNSNDKSLQSPDISFLGNEKEALNLGNIVNQKQHFLWASCQRARARAQPQV